MRPIYLSRALVAADPNGIAEAQNLAAAGDLTLDGILVAGGVADLGDQRKVLFTAGGGDDLSGLTFTVYGYADGDVPIQETVVGPVDATPVSTVLDFTRVTRIAASAAFPAAETVEVGTSDVGASPPIPLDVYISPFNVSLAVLIDSGDTVDVSAEYTLDNIQSGPGPFDWFPLLNLTNITANTSDSLISPATAVRLVTNSGTDSATFAVIQAGIQ